MVAFPPFRPDWHLHGLTRFGLAVVAVITVILGLTTQPAVARSRPCRFAGTLNSRASRSEIQRSVVCLVNEERAARGLPRLTESAKLNRSAQGWTDVMVDQREFSHGADFAARISGVGFAWSNAGENIATGYATPAGVVAAWMASPGHCRNILSPSFREVGTGVSDRSIPGFGSRGGTWTQDFALGMGQSAPSGDWGPADGCPY